MKSSPRILIPALAFASLLAAVPPAPAAADVSVTVLNADKIQGSIDDEDERESFAIDCPAGARLTVVLKGLKGFQPEMRVYGADGEEAFGDAITVKKTTVKLKVAALPASGTYRIEVLG